VSESGYEPCPEKPCKFCHGDSAVVTGRDADGNVTRMTSWEWCKLNDACAATIDWELIFHGR
jgi:hypothetical protein